jgi:hypothetical protein
MSSGPPPAQTPPTTSLPPAPRLRGGGGTSLPTALAGAAIVLSLIAVAISVAVPGPTGATGAASGGSGAPSVTFYAVVSATGALSRDAGVASSYLVSKGHYQVNFTTFQFGCTYEVGLGTTGGGTEPAGSASVTPPPSPGTDANVTTFNATGVVTNESFQLLATCPGGLYASVNATGMVLGGAGVESSSLVAVTGAYQVLFDQPITTCAYVAGLGTLGGGTAPAGSATVAERSGHTNGVYVTTYNAEGVFTNETFHVTVYC